jgi:integrase
MTSAQGLPKVTDFATKSSIGVARQKVSELADGEKKKFNFNKKNLAVLPPSGTDQRTYYYDAGARGLCLAVSPAGKKTFVLYRKIAGKPERITIGPFPDLSIEEARGKVSELNGAIARGENPASKRRLVRDEATLGELFATFLEHHAKPYRKTWKNDQGRFDKHLNGWKPRKLSDITRMDIVTLHKNIGARSGHYIANRIIELLRIMFNKAAEWGWDGENPATKIKTFKERSRRRFLQPAELPPFWQSLEAEPNSTIRDFILLSLFCGARRSNTQEMRWEEIDWENATWSIPAAKAKSDEDMVVPLSAIALSILKTRKDAATSEWVFSGHGRTGHLVEPKTAWKRVLERAATIQKRNWLEANPGKCEADFAKEFPNAFRDLRIHDLRRSLGSWQAITGSSLPVIGQSLGHRSLEATKIYSHLIVDPVRQSIDKATSAMLGAGKLLGPGSNG